MNCAGRAGGSCYIQNDNELRLPEAAAIKRAFGGSIHARYVVEYD
jgi:hypothetical protein